MYRKIIKAVSVILSVTMLMGITVFADTITDLQNQKNQKEKPTENTSQSAFSMPVVGVEPTRVISTRDFEFSGGFSIWCHLVIFKVI